MIGQSLDKKLIKFGIVGVSGVLINNAMLLLLTSQGIGEVVAAMLATEIAIITNFLGNFFWTWGEEPRHDWQKKFLYFQGISLLAGVVTVSLFWILRQLGLPLLIANTAAIGISFTINFALNKRITWKKTVAKVNS
jgi:dolichol-phosphate mannosyltransferase